MLNSATAPPVSSRRKTTPTNASSSSSAAQTTKAAASHVRRRRPAAAAAALSAFNMNRMIVLVGCVVCLGSISMIPIFMLERYDRSRQQLMKNHKDFVGIPNGASALQNVVERGNLLKQLANKLQREAANLRQRKYPNERRTKEQVASDLEALKKQPHDHAQEQEWIAQQQAAQNQHKIVHESEHEQIKTEAPEGSKDEIDPNIRRKHPLPITLQDLKPDSHAASLPLARGIAGLPLDKTPALVGAQRAHIDCNINVDSVAYWNDPQGTRDIEFVSPFDVRNELNHSQHIGDQERYITFSSDRGGWNNVRMSMEIIFVLAAATGRTLVLPPKEPLYLLTHGTDRFRGFADFYPLETAAFQQRVKVISMKDYIQREFVEGSLKFDNDTQRTTILNVVDHCENRAKSDQSCFPLHDFLTLKGKTVNISAERTCVALDPEIYHSTTAELPADSPVLKRLHDECGGDRELVYWRQSDYGAQHKTLHFRGAENYYRLLAHFYNTLYFTQPATDHYFKRFVRDFLHYQDSIYCAAGKIVKAVQHEAAQRGHFTTDSGAGGYSALHVRRGDLQYKAVKIPAAEWYDNTRELWKPNEILYVATDERNKTFFDDLAVHHDLRFLDDYWDFAELGKLDGNYMGMIDTIVASRGRVFAGTWFSTFTGFINRMRGYHGFSMHDSWYSYKPKKSATQEWVVVNSSKYAFEWPDGWIGIDGDEIPSREIF